MITRNGMRWCGLSLFTAGAIVASACSSTSGDANGGSAAATTSSSSSSGATSSGTGGATGSSTSSSTGTTTTSSTTTSSTSSTSTSSSSSGTCAPTADANALSCPTGKCTIGNGGYDFTYSDTGPNTTICVAANTACVVGTLTAANPPSYTYYGAGFGINLAAAADGGPEPVQLTGAGITVQLSNIPAGGARLQVTVGGTPYCAAITTNPATIPWASFNTKCYDSPPDGTALSGAPATTNVEISLPSGTTEQSFNFCVEKITLTTM